MTFDHFQGTADDLSVVRSSFEITGNDAPAMAEIEPQESPLARRGIERRLEPLEGDAVDGDARGGGVVGDEVVLAHYDLTVPGQVGEHSVVRLDVRESRVDRLQ